LHLHDGKGGFGNFRGFPNEILLGRSVIDLPLRILYFEQQQFEVRKISSKM
jgi:hypothetical protein